MADFLRLIEVNAGGYWLKEGQRILHPTFSFVFFAPRDEDWSGELGRGR